MAQFSVAFLLIGTLRVATAAHGGHLPLKATDVDDVVTYAFGSDGLLEEYADAYGLCNIIATACHFLAIDLSRQHRSDFALFRSFTADLEEEEEEDTLFGQAVCDEGRAVVASSGPGCPPRYTGRFQTAWCARTAHNHDICTAAKNKASAKLRSDRKIPAACHQYITSTQPCRVVNCGRVRAC